MASFLDEGQITGVAPAAKKSVSQAPSTSQFLDEEAITGVRPERTFLSDLQGFLGEKIAEVPAAAKSVAEFVGAGIGMAGGAVAGSARAIEQMAKGKPRREALQEGLETSGRVGAALNPVTVATELLGYTPGPTVIDTVMEKLSAAIHHYGEKVEVGTKRTLLAEDVDLFAQLLMGAGFGKTTVKGVQKLTEKATAPRAAGTSMADMIPKEETLAQAVPDLMTPEQLKAAFAKAKENRVAGVSDTAAVDSIFAKAKARGLAQVGPKAPEGFLTPEEAVAASQRRIAEAKQRDLEVQAAEEAPVPFAGKTRLTEGLTLEEARTKVDAEAAPPTDLQTGVAKLRMGQGFNLTAAEKIALRASAEAGGKIVGLDGKPIGSGFTEHGKIDPRLLTALGITSAAVWAAFEPEQMERLATLGVIGTTAMAGHGKGSPLGALLKESAPYTFKTMEMLPKNAVEISRQQITDLLKKPELQAERPVLERVLEGLPEGKKVNAYELMSGLLEETAGWRLEPKETGKYADYGLENIDKYQAYDNAANAIPGQHLPATTTLYRLPEHMHMSDANHFSDARLFGWTREVLAEGVPHVVEIQSDLAQHAKGAVPEAQRGAFLQDLQTHQQNIAYLERLIETPAEWGPTHTSYNLRRELATERARTAELQAKLEATAVDSNLSPILKNWPRRLIRENLLKHAQGDKQAAMLLEDQVRQVAQYREMQATGGYGRLGKTAEEMGQVLKEAETRLQQLQEKAAPKDVVRFASADTVAKVEGWPKVMPDTPANKALQQLLQDTVATGTRAEIDALMKVTRERSTQFRDPGHQSIYNRYAGEITRYLKNLGGKEVVDATGNTWWEVPTDAALNKVGRAAKEGRGPAIDMMGAADPKLLAKIAAGVAAGAYIAQSDEPGKAAALLGLGTVGSRGAIKAMLEADLLKTIQAGGKNAEIAAAELYTRNAPRTLRMLEQKFGRQGVDVESALQEGMLSALTAVANGTFRGESKFSTFLHQATVNKAIDSLRRAEVRPETISMAEDVKTGERGLADTLGHLETPERAAMTRDLGVQLDAALERLDPRMREAFIAAEVEGVSMLEGAERFGINENTFRSRVHSARQSLQQILRGEKEGLGEAEFTPSKATVRPGQEGRASPEQMIMTSAIGIGAALGYVSDPNNSVRNAFYGALAGGVLGTPAGRKGLKEAIKSPDHALGAISTRLGNIAPELKFRLRGHEMRVLEGIDKANDAVLPFIQALGRQTKETQARVARALMNGDTALVQSIAGLDVTYPGVAKILGSLETQLQALGRFGEGVSNYFPRLVKDFEGLKAALGQEARAGLEKALLEAEAAMIKKSGRSLTDVEESIIANRYLFSGDQTSWQPGFAKSRTMKEVPENLQQFYEPPTESLLRYISGAVNDIEIAKFFGKDLATKKAGKKIYNDVDSSIGNLTARLMGEGKLTQEQAMELRGMLKARFEGGEKGMNSALANIRNVTNLGLLGNISSAATQLGDSAMVMYHHGLTSTLQAVTEKILGRERVKPKDLGLINHVAEELSEMGMTGRALHLGMKYSGFKAIDMFAKGLGMNAALIKNQRLVSTPEGAAQFRAKYQAAFGDGISKVIDDVRAGRRTADTDLLAFSELSDMQPVSKAEMPQAYLANPNGRMLYQLKTYMLKQTDIVRRDAYQEIAKGTPEGIMRGTKNLALLATTYALANVPGDVVKDLLAGRPVDPFTQPKLVENIFQTFGVNRYAGQQLGQGKVVETAVGIATPPLKVIQDIAKLDKKAVSYVPLAGRPIYERYLGGNERREIYEKRLENTGKGRGKGQPLSPAAKEYLRQKRLKRKEEERNARGL